MFKNKFKKFGGSHIPDIIEYIREYVGHDTSVTISVGCDSIQRRRKTIYACTIMLYNGDIKNGAHVVFFRESIPKVKETFERLHKEAVYCHDIAEYLNEELSPFYKRADLTLDSRRKYKFHLMKCNGEHLNMALHQEDAFVRNITLSEFEKTNDYKLVDIHLDFNPSEGAIGDKGVKNKSNYAYKSYTPWLRGMNYRVFCKPESYASTSAADLLLQD